MTYDELIQYHAEKYGLSFEEAEQQLNPDGKMPKVQTRSTTSTSYRVLSVTLNVSSTYKPKLEFYVVTDNWSSYWVIDHIYHIAMVRSYNGTSKQFAGNVTCWYRGNNKIEYTVNGDFYNNTTGTAGVEVNIGAGKSVTVSFSAKSSSNHYKYFYVHNTKTWSGNGNV